MGSRITSLEFGAETRFELGQRIKASRTKAGLDIEQLARDSSLADETIQQMENGEFSACAPNIALYTLVGIADAVNVRPEVFFAHASDDRAFRVTQDDVQAARETVVARLQRAARERRQRLEAQVPGAEGDATKTSVITLVRKLSNPTDLRLVEEFIQEVLAG